MVPSFSDGFRSELLSGLSVSSEDGRVEFSVFEVVGTELVESKLESFCSLETESVDKSESKPLVGFSFELEPKELESDSELGSNFSSRLGKVVVESLEELLSEASDKSNWSVTSSEIAASVPKLFELLFVEFELSVFVQLFSKIPLLSTIIFRIPLVGKSVNCPKRGLTLLKASSAKLTPFPKVKKQTGLPENAVESTVVSESASNVIELI